MSKLSIVPLAARLAPRLLWKYRIRSWHIDTGEPEQSLLPWLCKRDKVSLDIGAADGAYTAHMLLGSSSVVAFEPRQDAAAHLRGMFANTGLVRVEQVALSDSSGSAIMRVPAKRSMLSTIEVQNTLEGAPPFTTVNVARRRLDDYGFKSVGLIKIDVEGHERSVLEGARATLERERPTVLVEIEERHSAGALAATFGLFADLSWEGFWLLGDRLKSVKEFDPRKHQQASNLDGSGRRAGTYINNFLFMPSESIQQLPPHYFEEA